MHEHTKISSSKDIANKKKTSKIYFAFLLDLVIFIRFLDILQIFLEINKSKKNKKLAGQKLLG